MPPTKQPEKPSIVFDIETDGLTPTKIHTFCWAEGENVFDTSDPNVARDVFLRAGTLIGHNIVSYDLPVLERLWGIKFSGKIVDTLYLSWYLFPTRKLHGLEWWGLELGVEKPEINDWKNLSYEDYSNRGREDVKINQKLYKKQLGYLTKLYDTDDPESLPIINYLMFKADCAREQERSRWKLDVDWCTKALDRLEKDREPKLEALAKAMPRVEKRTLRQPPAKPYKKDGTLSVEGAKWQKYLLEQGLTKDHSDPIYIVTSIEEPNPNSPEQVKDWLFSLGWEPETFKFVKEDDGSERKIPQVKIPQSPNLCSSVLRLADVEPAIKELQGLSVVNHRIGLLSGFLKNVDEEGFLKARVHGLTNTLRFKHTEIVNLPGVGKPYGEEIRGCLIARDGYELVGTDMVSLEDTTKKHFMYDYDPEYVEEMSSKGFDPHLDLAKRAGVVSKEDVDTYVKFKDDDSIGDNLKGLIKSIGSLRKVYKVVNYSAVYGVGPPKLARELKSTVAFATELLESYWKRNWAVRKVAENCVVKTVNGQKWLFNPVSKFWYSLRADKDRFSTLNQGTGVYCFDSWVKECRKRRPQLTAQFHDEVIVEIKAGYFGRMAKLQQEAIEAVNAKLKLNVTLGISVQHGHRYSEIH